MSAAVFVPLAVGHHQSLSLQPATMSSTGVLSLVGDGPLFMLNWEKFELDPMKETQERRLGRFPFSVRSIVGQSAHLSFEAALATGFGSSGVIVPTSDSGDDPFAVYSQGDANLIEQWNAAYDFYQVTARHVMSGASLGAGRPNTVQGWFLRESLKWSADKNGGTLAFSGVTFGVIDSTGTCVDLVYGQS